MTENEKLKAKKTISQATENLNEILQEANSIQTILVDAMKKAGLPKLPAYFAMCAICHTCEEDLPGLDDLRTIVLSKLSTTAEDPTTH